MDRSSKEKKNVVTDDENSREARFKFLGYFSVHETNSSTENHCGKILKKSGIVYVETMRFALNEINKKNLLFGMKARYRIVDTCRNVATLVRSFPSTLKTYYMGVVGPTTSEEGSLVAVLHGAREAAVVSHSASSAMFDDRKDYKNFFRTIPSDVLQVKALVDTILFFNWSYVSIVHSHGFYGKWGSHEFLNMASEKKICIGRYHPLPARPVVSDYQKAINVLDSAEGANVVVLITGLHDTNAILEQARILNKKRFTWLSSTSWHLSTINAGQSARGALVLRYASSADKEFEQYFMGLSLESNKYEWFREFWNENFKCIGKNCSCSSNQTLRDCNFSLGDISVDLPLSTIHTIACSLRKSIMKRCPSLNLTCINKIRTSTYHFEKDISQFIRDGNSSCPEFRHSVNVNKMGYYNRDFEVMNFDGFKYKKVARWSFNESSRVGSLQLLKEEEIVWANYSLPQSFCSVPCKSGQKIIWADNLCCYSCKDCGSEEIVVDNECSLCFWHQKPDRKNNSCVSIPTATLKQKEPVRSVTLVGSVVGIIANSIFLCLFVRNWKNRIIKASSRELSLAIFIALYICFLCPVVFLLYPSEPVCRLQRFIVGISLTSCYTPVMLKTNRIFRIFNAAEVMKSKPTLVSTRSQILICIALIFLQLLLGILWVIGDPPEVFQLKTEGGGRIAIVCKTASFNFILNLLPCLIVMSVCTFYAYKTRRFPSNFNEALNICITMYFNCFVWGIFIIIILFLETRVDDIFIYLFTIANFTTIIGVITFMGIFGPKIWKLYCAKDVVPVTEHFSQFNSSIVDSPHLRTLNINSLSTIEEDREDFHPRKRRKDVSTNT